jgi:DMSO/TMAO reductase YedYZ molybdopterin-dependent catalytic subunit
LPSAKFVTFQSMEGPYVDQLSIEQFTLPDVMIARQMDGGPISRAHGAPLRLVIPDMYGYKNVKWLASITFVAKASAGFWEQRGYDIDAWVGRSNGYG